MRMKEFPIRSLGSLKKVTGRPLNSYESGNIPYVTGSQTNNGVVGYVLPDEASISKGNCIAIDPIKGMCMYQKNDFVGRGFSGASINLLYIENITEEAALYVCSVIEKHASTVASYSNLFNSNRLADATISLPVTTKYVPDFETMSALAGGGIDMSKIDTSSWKEFKLEELFEKIDVPNMSARAADFPKEQSAEYIIPLLTCQNTNQGFARFAREEDCNNILQNAISIAANGTAVAFYQPEKFSILQDAYAIHLKNGEELTQETGLFFASAINKLLSENGYCWTNKAGWNKIREEKIFIPVKESEEIDWEYMHKYIRAMEKVVIKDVVQWKDKELALTKNIVSGSGEQAAGYEHHLRNICTQRGAFCERNIAH